MQQIKVKILQGLNWQGYNLYCHRNGLSNGNFKNLRKYMKINKINTK